MTNEQYAVLTDELRNDPLGVGYANMRERRFWGCQKFILATLNPQDE